MSDTGFIPKVDLVGQKMGRWAVISYAGGTNKSNAKWLCRCECGTTREVSACVLRDKKKEARGCGCGRKVPRHHVHHVGERFHKWTVIDDIPGEFNPDGIHKMATWKCRCDCGTERYVIGNALRMGTTRSCGCIRNEDSEDGARWRSRRRGPEANSADYPSEYKTWMHMKERCFDPDGNQYKDYGGRGIGICEFWLRSFDAFIQDMGPKPEGTSIDRIDNDGNYEPGNCRWATDKEQARNTRRTIHLTYKGETRPLPEWAEIIQCKYMALYSRIRKGWPVDKAIETPFSARSLLSPMVVDSLGETERGGRGFGSSDRKDGNP